MAVIFSPGCSCSRFTMAVPLAVRPASGISYAFQAVYASLVGKEHHIMMGCGHQQILDIILLNGLHALDSLAAAVLALEIIRWTFS